MTKKIAPMSQLAERHPLHPLMIVIGVLIVALSADIGPGVPGAGLEPACLAASDFKSPAYAIPPSRL